jgi:hypothetical protein
MTMKRICALLATVCLCLLGAAAPAPAATANGCPSVGERWADTGPFTVTSYQSGTGHTIYRPAQLGALGCTSHPVIIWGNGTGTTPSTYDGLLRHWASHGFVVAAANTTQAGDGREMLEGLDYLQAQNQAAGSPLQGMLDMDHVAAAGHSQGGGGAINAGNDPRVGYTLPIQPAPGDESGLHGPAFYLAGRLDTIVVPELMVKPMFENSDHIVALYGNLTAAYHLTPGGNGNNYRGPETAWLRFELMGDEQARGLFYGPSCGYCEDPQWFEFLRNEKAEAVPGP